jgi:hypothetical protein
MADENVSDPRERPLPYPWENSDALAAVLQDGSLWAKTLRFPAHRRAIKAAAKTVLAERGVQSTDDDRIGQLTVRLLETRRGRSALFQEIRRYLKQRPEDVLAGVGRALAGGKPLPGALYEGQGIRAVFAARRFSDWVAGGIPAEWTPDELLRAVAPVAIRHPRDAGIIAAALRSCGVMEEAQTSATDAMPQESTEEADLASTVASEPMSNEPVRDTPSSRGALSRQFDETLEQLHAALAFVLEANRRAGMLSQNGDLDRAQVEMQAAIEGRDELRERYASLLKRDDVRAARLDDEIPHSAFTADGGNAWLARIREGLLASEAHHLTMACKRRDDLAARLRQLRLDVPYDLRTATALDDLTALCAREEERVRIETTWQALIRDRDLDAFGEQPPALRRQHLDRLLDQSEHAHLALAVFVADREVRAACPLDRLVPLLVHLIKCKEALPQGTWSALRERAGAAFAGLLDNHRVAETIADADDDAACISELEMELRRAEPPADHAFADWLAERNARRLAPAERLGVAAASARSLHRPVWITMVIATLAELGRHAEAVLVATAALRQARLDESALETTRAAFLHLLIEATGRESTHTILKSILASPAELVDEVDGFVIVLYVATLVSPDLVDTLVYRDPTKTDTALKKYPFLVGKWLLMTKGGMQSRDAIVVEGHRLAECRQEYTRWRHDLERRSLYAGWPSAQEYQVHMVALLRERFAELCADGHLDVTPDVDEVLSNIQQRHALPLAVGPARRNMLAYLETQFERLELFREFAFEVGVSRGLEELLAKPETSLHYELMQEARSLHGPLRHLYEAVLAQVAP